MEKHLRVGNVLLESPVWLAPISGYTDLTFRLQVRALGGTGLAFAEMIDARSVLFGSGRKRESLLATEPGDEPLCYQLCGNDATLMAEAAAWLVENRKAAIIDINMGCPERKIAGRGAGAGLLRNAEAAATLAGTVVKAAPVPVTAKLRLGESGKDPFAAARLAPMLEEAGVAAITVHGRTADQRYSGTCNLNAIRQVVESARRIPVIGNGDILSPDDAKSMISQTGCAGVMIGRAALKRPWLIRDTARALEGRPVSRAPSRKTRVAFLLTHFDAFAARHGGAAALMFRRWIPQYAAALQLERQVMVDLLQIRDNRLLRLALRKSFGALIEESPAAVPASPR